MKYAQQFLGSLYRNLTGLHGVINLVAQTKASLVNQGVTYTAASFGAAGNSITITLAAGGTAGSEVVTVVGSDISISIASGTSTVDDIVAAVSASVPATGLVVATGSGATTVNALAKTALSGGTDGVSSFDIAGVDSVVQSGVGELTLTLSRKWPFHLWTKCMLQSATAQDLIPQVESSALVTGQTTKIRLLTGATPTSPTSACKLYVGMWFRDSTVSK